jgi:hypothetical protein
VGRSRGFLFSRSGTFAAAGLRGLLLVRVLPSLLSGSGDCEQNDESGTKKRGAHGGDDTPRAQPLHLPPIDITSAPVRSSSRPSEIAGDASTGADISFIAICSYAGPALMTKICPSSLAI